MRHLALLLMAHPPLRMLPLVLVTAALWSAGCDSGGSGGVPSGGCTCVVPGGGAMLACGTSSCVNGKGWSCAAGVISEAPSACQGGSACQPSCVGAVCGPDGCGGECGTCATGTACERGTCVPQGIPCKTVCGVDIVCGPDGCGGECGRCKRGEVCQSGACVPEGTPCQPSCGAAVCGPNGCGGECGTCGSDETCESGACVKKDTPCQPTCGTAVCGPDGCGGKCGTCNTGELCADGACVPEQVGCPEGKYECDGGCVDYLSDPLHCGSCPGKCPTREGALAICIEANCYLSCEDQAHIPADVDFDNDVENCGRCGNKCPTKPGGTAECYLGECVEPCEAVGLTDCGGICVDTRENRSHCGECDEVCAAEAECEYGRCDCGSWMQHCDGECVDDDSVDHCGECNKVCPEVPNASRRCWSRECDHSCNSDYVKCGEDEACLGAGGAECSNDDDCCGAKGYVCYLGQCTAYPGCPNYTQDCPDPERYECAFDVCLKKCSSDSDCPDDSGRSGRCYERQWSSAHGFYVGTDACYLSCGQDSDCPYSGMRCSNTNWAESGKMCIWD